MASDWISVNGQLGYPKPGSVDSSAAVPLGTVASFRDIGSTALGLGEFIYLKGVASTVAGSVVSYQVSDGTAQTGTTILWAGTANVTYPLALATAATVASTYGWYQIGGSGIAAISGSITAGNDLFWQAAGVLSATAIAGKGVMALQAASAHAVPASGQAIVTMDRPTSQGGVADGQAAATVGPRNYGVDAGIDDTYVIALSPALVAYAAGLQITFKANTANTGAASLNVNGLGAKTIVKAVSTTLSDNDILASMLCVVVYDGTNFVLQNPRAL